MRFTFNQEILSKAGHPHPHNMMYLSQLVGGLKRNKSELLQNRRNPASRQVFRLNRRHRLFPRSPVCQSVCHNCVSQILKSFLSLHSLMHTHEHTHAHTHTPYWFCVSGEPWLNTTIKTITAIITTIIVSTITTIPISIIVAAALIESRLHQPLYELLLVKTSWPALPSTPRGRCYYSPSHRGENAVQGGEMGTQRWAQASTLQHHAFSPRTSLWGYPEVNHPTSPTSGGVLGAGTQMVGGQPCAWPSPEHILQWERESEQGPGLFESSSESLPPSGPASGLTSCFLPCQTPPPFPPPSQVWLLLRRPPQPSPDFHSDTPLQPPSGPSPLSAQMTLPSQTQDFIVWRGWQPPPQALLAGVKGGGPSAPVKGNGPLNRGPCLYALLLLPLNGFYCFKHIKTDMAETGQRKSISNKS